MEKGGEKARNFSKTHVWTRSVAGLLGQADKGSFSCRQLRVRHHSRQRTTPPLRERKGTRGDSCLGDRVPRAGTTSLLTRPRGHASPRRRLKEPKQAPRSSVHKLATFTGRPSAARCIGSRPSRGARPHKAALVSRPRWGLLSRPGPQTLALPPLWRRPRA
jgi:hypothetical protein